MSTDFFFVQEELCVMTEIARLFMCMFIFMVR